MIKLNKIRRNLKKVFALTEKNLKLQMRFKFGLIISTLAPIISIIMPLIIMSKFLEYNAQF